MRTSSKLKAKNERDNENQSFQFDYQIKLENHYTTNCYCNKTCIMKNNIYDTFYYKWYLQCLIVH